MSLFVLELLLQVIFTHHNIVKNDVAHYESNTIVRKKIESQSKSGSAAHPNSSKWSFYSQFSFLDQVIKRRR